MEFVPGGSTGCRRRGYIPAVLLQLRGAHRPSFYTIRMEKYGNMSAERHISILL